MSGVKRVIFNKEKPQLVCDEDEFEKMKQALAKALESNRCYKEQLNKVKYQLEKSNEIIGCLGAREVTTCDQCDSYAIYDHGGGCVTCEAFLCEDCNDGCKTCGSFLCKDCECPECC